MNNIRRWMFVFQRPGHSTMLQQLRQTLASFERPSGLEITEGPVCLGIAPIDATLGGGLATGALHEISAASESHLTSATGFALSWIKRQRTTIWIAEDMMAIENGSPCGFGIDEAGFDPARLITVTVSHQHDLFWAMEEALHCRAVGAVIGELRSNILNPVMQRRLSLAATKHSALAILLRSSPRNDASTAMTRWIVRAALSRPHYGPGPPRIEVHLARNRRGQPGSWLLEWNYSDVRFCLASAYPQPMASSALNRPSSAVA